MLGVWYGRFEYHEVAYSVASHAAPSIDMAARVLFSHRASLVAVVDMDPHMPGGHLVSVVISVYIVLILGTDIVSGCQEPNPGLK